MLKICFPQIKSVFKNNTHSQIPNLIIDTNNENLINNDTISIDKCQTLIDKIIISDPQDKANVLAKYLADINNTNRILSSPRLEQIITRTVAEFKEKNKININQTNHLIEFSNLNKSIAPKFEINPSFFMILFL